MRVEGHSRVPDCNALEILFPFSIFHLNKLAMNNFGGDESYFFKFRFYKRGKGKISFNILFICFLKNEKNILNF